MSTENNNIETLANLVDLTKAFKAATEHAGFFTRRKIKKALTSDETFAIMGDAMGGMMSGMMSGFFGTSSAPSEDSLRTQLKQVETYAGVVQRALSDKKIAKLVPAKDRTEENANALKQAGFPKLASLYTPKQ